MTVKQARRILGKEAKTLSDDELLVDISSAQFLKDLFFSHLQTENTLTKLAKQPLDVPKSGSIWKQRNE